MVKRGTNKGGWMLSESEEALLSQYFDGECSFITRRRAQRLINSNPLAQVFLEHLTSVGSQLKQESALSGVSVDLWSKIEARIDSEERAALYLGERRREPERLSLLDQLRSKQALFGGLSGAAVAASVLLFVAAPADKSSVGPAPQSFQQAAVGGLEAQPASFSPNAQPAMEVDWMRANGSLKLFQNPSGKSATIWVRRNPQLLQGRGTLPNTPIFIATPYRGIDGTRQDLSK